MHSAARLTLFTLGKVLVQECRVKGADFIRKRRTFVQTAHAAKQQNGASLSAGLVRHTSSKGLERLPDRGGESPAPR